MFRTVAGRIQAGDVKAVEVLCGLGAVLGDLMGKHSSLHDALASATPGELEGLKAIADISPKDGRVDACEWSECLKAIYPFTLVPADREALAMDEGRPEYALTDFLSWHDPDAALCTKW